MINRRLLLVILTLFILITIAGCAKNTYKIEVDYDSSAGEVTGIGEYIEGEEVKLQALPNEKFHFVRFVENGKELTKEPTYSFTANKDRNIKAEFDKVSVKVDVIAPNGSTSLESGYYKKGEILSIEAIPDQGYYFSEWFAYDKDFILDDQRINKKIEVRVTEDIKLRANLIKETNKTVDQISMSEDKRHILGVKDSRIVVLSSDELKEVASYEVDGSLDDLAWYDNSSFIIFSNNNVILQEIAGDKSIIQENISYTATNNIFKNNLYDKYIIEYEHNELNEDRYVGKVDITIFNLGNKLTEFSVDYAADGPFYSKPIFSNNQKHIAIRGTNLYIFDIEKDEFILKTNTLEPLYWRNEDNIIGFNDQILYSGVIESFQFVNYNFVEDKFTIILTDVSHQLDRDLNEKIFSPDNKKVIYSQFSDYYIRDKSTVYLKKIDYEHTNDFDKFSYYEEVKSYKYEQTELMEGFLRDIIWYDNKRAIFSVSDDRFNGDYNTYLLEKSELTELPIESKKIIGIFDNILFYTSDGSIEKIHKFDLTQIME